MNRRGGRCILKLNNKERKIENLKKEFDVPISLDTYKGNVAKEGIKAGADFINDISQ